MCLALFRAGRKAQDRGVGEMEKKQEEKEPGVGGGGPAPRQL